MRVLDWAEGSGWCQVWPGEGTYCSGSHFVPQDNVGGNADEVSNGWESKWWFLETASGAWLKDGRSARWRISELY